MSLHKHRREKCQSTVWSCFSYICTHRQMLCTWHKQPDLIQTTGWVNSSHPAEAHKPETRALQQEMGHDAWEGSFKCGLLPSTHWEPRKQICNIHWRSAVLHDYRASQAEVMSKLGAVIIPLSLRDIYSGPSEKMRQDCVTWLPISFKKRKSRPGWQMNLAESRTNPTHNFAPQLLAHIMQNNPWKSNSSDLQRLETQLNWGNSQNE